MAVTKTGLGIKTFKRAPRKRPGRHSKSRGMKTAFTGKHPR